MLRVFFLLCLVVATSAHCQVFPPVSEVKEPPLFNAHLQYTASLLDQKKSHVRVLIYGQSISVQDWWKDVRHYFLTKYPNTTFTFSNRAIGGFSSERLKLTAENDIVSFYPDLILFHDYGNEDDYEKIIRLIRSKTIADIAIQTDHMADQNQEWHDKHSSVWLPELCKKYGLALIDIRKYWKLYLRDNNFQIKDLLVDGVHLNDHGNYLMAEIIKEYFNNLQYDRTPHNRITRLKKDKDFTIRHGSITIPMSGNRVDISWDDTAESNHVDLVLDDDQSKPTRGCFYHTRPTLKSTGEFLTRIGSLFAIDFSDRVQEESWVLEILSVDSVKQELKFSLHGSITGSDGIGTSVDTFISNSGSITIGPDSWFIRRHEGDFSQYHWIKQGDGLQWQMKNSCSTASSVSGSDVTTLIQGITNTTHKLEISGPGLNQIKEILVYAPPLKD